MNFEFDEKAFTRFLTKQQKEVLPKAAAGFLNGIAFEAQKKLKAHVPESFSGFVKFTERAFVVKKADARSTNIVAEVSALPAQAAYLKFQIDGGTRLKGDAGAGPFDLFVYGAKKDRAGNIKNGYSKQLSTQYKEERSKRRSLRQQRDAAREAGEDVSQFAFFRANKKPGIFFAEVNGIRGYWQRPKRSKAAKKRQIGVQSVRYTDKLKPLLTVSDTAKYKPRFMYQSQIQKALRIKGNQQNFAAEINRYINK